MALVPRKTDGDHIAIRAESNRRTRSSAHQIDTSSDAVILEQRAVHARSTYRIRLDRDFIIDSVLDHPRIFVAQDAAHAFKFAALIGQIVTDLAVRGETTYPIELFSASRAALTDPAFTLALHI